MNFEIFRKNPKTILNKGTGYLSGYSHSLNPYAGCSFACSYCYVRRLPIATFRKQEWGTWVDIKQGASQLLLKELKRAKRNGPVTIFMSSSTDPYQPVEFKEKLTRSLLEALVEEKPDFLLVQTRSPLVGRDIDLLQKLGDRVRVSMTIETDREDIRKHFTPQAPPIPARLMALQSLRDAGIPAQATIAPVLPSTHDFSKKLKKVVSRICVDDYFMGDGSGGKRTKSLGIPSKYMQLGLEEWYHPSAYQTVCERLKKDFADDQIFLNQDGFLP